MMRFRRIGRAAGTVTGVFLLWSHGLLGAVSGPGESGEWPDWLGPVTVLGDGGFSIAVAERWGRVVSFRTDGHEWLFFSDDPAGREGWRIFGGDKIWPAPQPLFPAIRDPVVPDPEITGPFWKRRGRGDGASLRIRSAVSESLGVRVERTIRVDPEARQVILDQRIEQRRHSPFPVHAWAVTQIESVDRLAFDSQEAMRHPGEIGYRNWFREGFAREDVTWFVDRGRLVIEPVSEDSFKVGNFGDWIAAESEAGWLVQEIRFDPEAIYLDRSCLQLYGAGGRRYQEMETLSPTWFLRKGESRQWRITWHWLPEPGMEALEAWADDRE